MDKTPKRTGECKRCGRCCTGGELLKSTTVAEKLFLKLHIRKGVSLKELWNIKCPSLRFNNRGKARCKKYKERPDFCQKYPEVVGDLVKDCGFSFSTIQRTV